MKFVVVVTAFQWYLLVAMSESKFTKWLRQQHQREDIIGDFARDIFWAKSAPKHSNDPKVWRGYVKLRRLSFLLSGFEEAWKEYLTSKSE
jgi:uncharacterized protein YozE (UPF0346 family)